MQIQVQIFALHAFALYSKASGNRAIGAPRLLKNSTAEYDVQPAQHFDQPAQKPFAMATT